jgi:hypothetical protein
VKVLKEGKALFQTTKAIVKTGSTEVESAGLFDEVRQILAG